MLVRIEPETPQWWKRAALQLEQVFAPINPTGPQRLKGYATASLPNPASWPYSICYDLTLQQPVYSDGSSWIPM